MQNTSEFTVCLSPIEFTSNRFFAPPQTQGLYYPPIKKAGSLHYHHSLEIGVCMEGSGIFYIGNRIFPFSAGDISVILPGTVHIAQSNRENPGGWKFLNINLDRFIQENPFGENIAEPFLSGKLKSTMIYKGNEPEILSLCNQILKESEGLTNFYNTALSALSILLLISLSRTKEDGSVFSSHPLDFEEIAPAIFFLLENYSKRIDIDRLCDLCNLSASSFRRKFKTAFHMSPSQYLYNIRIKAAAGLLRTTVLPITDISERVGYETLSSFLRHFGRIMNTSPSGYRKSCLAEEVVSDNNHKNKEIS